MKGEAVRGLILSVSFCTLNVPVFLCACLSIMDSELLSVCMDTWGRHNAIVGKSSADEEGAEESLPLGLGVW